MSNETVWVNLRDESRKQLGKDVLEGQILGLDFITLGAMLRIADSLELLTDDKAKLKDDATFWKDSRDRILGHGYQTLARAKKAEREVKKLQRKLAAIKQRKAAKRLKKPKDDSVS